MNENLDLAAGYARELVDAAGKQQSAPRGKLGD